MIEVWKQVKKQYPGYIVTAQDNEEYWSFGKDAEVFANVLFPEKGMGTLLAVRRTGKISLRKADVEIAVERLIAQGQKVVIVERQV